ncbi:hypothetical protein DP939_21880 [Spongiactinospora rosea]|uniref:Uncharacterized protein n=1 Tax=Spongiactinospora rosea TaxID=2248750 RepID=A0A366LXI9_9ACTN|nr:hypothetical protein DP939_21880 [Spongiactinospora rosea]
MTKLSCECGRSIRIFGEIPNPLEWKIISDSDFDRFQGAVDAEDVYRACISMFRCHGCGRLWVYWGGFEGTPVCYRPEG